uniref:Trefoil factor 1 n=1 Tax=Nannospalax galili TaxID=1026970 RepID=A0A8C6QCD2_NANGA
MDHKVTRVFFMILMLALSNLALTQEDTCAVTPRERVNCGFPGVSAQECESRGCCFDSAVRGFPWCFHPRAVENPPEEECPF